MAKQWDTIIVGGGVGGAALGALLSSGGQKVLLLEKNSIIGGRCASYEREGFVVDVGVHLFGLGEKGPLSEVLRRSGEPDGIDWVLARNPRVAMHYKGETRPFTRELMMENVDKTDLPKLAGAFVSVMQMKEAELNELWHVPLTEWLFRYTTERQALAMFAMLCGIYLCVTPDEASTAEFIVCLREVMRERASAYPKGGCIAIPKSYQRVIEKHGGEVRLSAPVERIVVESGRAVGVAIGGETIRADRVVSNADIKATVDKLTGPKHFPKEYVERVRSLKWTAHVVALKVALDTRVTDQKMVMYAPDLTEEEQDQLAETYLKGGPLPMLAGGMINSPTNFDPDLAPAGGQLLFFGSRCERHQDWKQWGEILMTGLKEVFPEIEGHVVWSAVDSPDTVERYAGEDGNVIGVGQTFDQVADQRPAHETPVPGLYLVGAEAGGHGIGTELAAYSALELSEKLLS